MEFTKIKQFVEERAEMSGKQAAVKQQRDSALEAAQALKAEFEATIRHSMETGQDAGKALDALSVRIEEAERVFKRKDRELQVAAAVMQPKMTADEVVAAWNTEFKPAFKESKFDPAAEALLAAKKAYIAADQHYRSVVHEYEGIRYSAASELSPADPGRFKYKMTDVDFQRTTETDVYFLKDADLFDLKTGRIVRSLAGVEMAGA